MWFLLQFEVNYNYWPSFITRRDVGLLYLFFVNDGTSFSLRKGSDSRIPEPFLKFISGDGMVLPVLLQAFSLVIEPLHSKMRLLTRQPAVNIFCCFYGIRIGVCGGAVRDETFTFSFFFCRSLNEIERCAWILTNSSAWTQRRTAYHQLVSSLSEVCPPSSKDRRGGTQFHSNLPPSPPHHFFEGNYRQCIGQQFGYGSRFAACSVEFSSHEPEAT